MSMTTGCGVIAMKIYSISTGYMCRKFNTLVTLAIAPKIMPELPRRLQCCNKQQIEFIELQRKRN